MRKINLAKKNKWKAFALWVYKRRCQRELNKRKELLYCLCFGVFFFFVCFFFVLETRLTNEKDRLALNRSFHVLDSLLARSIRCWQVVKINCVSTYVYPNWQKSFSFSFLLKKTKQDKFIIPWILCFFKKKIRMKLSTQDFDMVLWNTMVLL